MGGELVSTLNIGISVETNVPSPKFAPAMPRKKKDQKEAIRQLDQAVKREAQKAQGALDGRFREKKVESKKRYTRKPKHKGPEAEGTQ
jgi:hypothetical protein